MSEQLSALEELTICQQLTSLKGRYCRSLDAQDWPTFQALFAPDATMDFRGAGSTLGGNDLLHGAAQIVDTIRAANVGITSVHQCHTPEFTVSSPTEATAIWHLASHLRWPEGSPVRAKDGFGYYYDTYVKLGGEWKIKLTRLARILNEDVSAGR